MSLLIAYALLALGVSFLCSLLEAALLSLTPSYVALLVERGSRTGRRLQRMKERVDRPLSAILTLNTIAHTVGAAGVGAEAFEVFGSAAVGIASAVMTFLILVVSEIIPKTLGAVHAKRLAGFTAVTTGLVMLVTYPVIVMIEWVNRWVGFKRGQSGLDRSELMQTIHLGWHAGALDPREHRTISNVLSLDKIKVRDIMTPRTVVLTFPAARTVREVVEENRPLRFSRVPIHRDSPDDVAGYVTRFELNDAYRAGRLDEPIEKLVRPLQCIPEQTTVADAFDRMLRGREHILLVVDEFGGVEGIVTLEDALETMLGLEIVDESDAAPDLQEVARKLARRRQRERSGKGNVSEEAATDRAVEGKPDGPAKGRSA